MRCEICQCEPCQTPGFCTACREFDGGKRRAAWQSPYAVPSDCQFLKKVFGNNTPFTACECGWPEQICAFHRQAQAQPPPYPLPQPDLPDHWDTMSVGELWDWLNRPERFATPKSTLDAAEWLFDHARDAERLKDFLDRHSERDRSAIRAHIETLIKRRQR